MKTMLRWTSALCMLSVSTMASAVTLPAGFTGYNEAWFENYGAWLASNPLFSEPSAITPGCTPSNTCSGLTLVSNMLSGMMQGNAKIVRIWLFPALQGICINTTLTTCPQATQGLTSDFLNNLTQVFTLARSYNLKLYITALNADDASAATPSNCPEEYKKTYCPPEYTYYQNLFSNSNNYNSGATQTYEKLVLGPVLTLMNSNQDVIYGFDLINEIEAAINASYFSWAGAQAWIQNMTAFVKKSTTIPPATASWLPVTSTAGLGYAVQDVTTGLFSGLGLNFYDVHIYSNSGTIARPSALSALCSKTKSDGLQIVLGEYGQTSSATSDTTQNTATTNFLNGAHSSCFSAALAWKYEALYTGTPNLSYLYINSSGGLFQPPCPPKSPQLPGPACARPAYTTIKNFNP